MKVRNLIASGWSERRIARELGISRNTVARAAADTEPRQYQREPAPDPCAPWQKFLEEGVRQGLRGSRLLADLQQQGYAGSRSALYRRLGEIRKSMAEPKAFARFETDPGEQAQFDWGEYSLTVGDQVRKVYVHSVLYGYSRRVHWFPSLSCRQPAIFEALEASFWHFGGACRSLVVDNPKALVLRHGPGETSFHPNFLAFCGHYRILPIAATPRHPQTKGKVENGFGHLEEMFLRGRTWPVWEVFSAELAEFETHWNERVHGTTKVRPVDRFAEERLIPLPVRRYLGVAEEFREVSKDCLISYGRVSYSVPWQHAGRQVLIRTEQGRSLAIYSLRGEELACYEIRPPGSPPVITREHFTGMARRHRVGLTLAAARFRERYGATGEIAETFLQRLIGREQYRPAEALCRVLELLEGAPEAVAIDVMAKAVECNLCSPKVVAGLLQQQLVRSRCPRPLPDLTSTSQLTFPHLEVERPLEGYGAALDPSQSLPQPGK